MSNTKKSLWIASLGAIGASACCVGPLILLSLGIGGTWVGSLAAMQPYRPYFIAITLALLAIAYYQLYLKSQPCDDEMECANPAVQRRQKIIFWIVSSILLLLLASPYYLPYLL